jgi:hypothetical protein
MYGLGIRLGFYLQWVGGILAAWIAPEEAQSLRLANTLFVAATFLALITQVAQNAIESVEIYLVLLLTFGSTLYLVPIFLWRFATGFRPEWDPTRWPRTKPPSKIFNVLYSILLLAVLVFQFWYWAVRVMRDVGVDCDTFGFLFTRVELWSPALRWLNVALSGILAASIATLHLVRLCCAPETENQESGLGEFGQRARVFQVVDSGLKFVVAVTIIAATELVIMWNKISGVYSVSPAGQTIPLVLGIGALTRVLYKGFFGSEERNKSSLRGPTGFHILPTKFHNVPVNMAPSATSLNDLPMSYGSSVEPTHFDQVPTFAPQPTVPTRYYDVPMQQGYSDGRQ